jgi:hypothetical protein
MSCLPSRLVSAFILHDLHDLFREPSGWTLLFGQWIACGLQKHMSRPNWNFYVMAIDETLHGQRVR